MLVDEFVTCKPGLYFSVFARIHTHTHTRTQTHAHAEGGEERGLQKIRDNTENGRDLFRKTKQFPDYRKL